MTDIQSLIDVRPDLGHRTPEPLSELRRDGDLILTGSGGYIDDLDLSEVAHAAILRSPYPAARIVSINMSRAACARGVLTTMTGADVRANAGPLMHFFDPKVFGLPTTDVYALAGDTVRWVGEPVAAVVAETLADAERALDLIDVEYEPLPYVLDAHDAMKPDSPKVFEEWDDNILAMFPFEEGDVDSALEASTYTLTGTVSIDRSQTVPLEGRGYVGKWGRGEKITLYASTQNPHLIRTGLAMTLGVDESAIRVVQPRVGGGFGHKFNGYQEESLVCLLSRRIGGRAVKWQETREVGLLVGAREFHHEFTVGFEPDGRLTALHDKSVANIGCLSTWGGWSMIYPNGMTFPGPYTLRNYRVESYGVVTNKAPWSGARGYGKESGTVVIERIVDLVARRTGMDPVEVRRVNFIPPDAFPYWNSAKHLDSGNYQGALDGVLDLSDYEGWRSLQVERTADQPLLGVGVGFEVTAEGGDFGGSLVRGHDTTTVRVSPTGSITVLTGVTSAGTGNETSIAALVAREFGVHPSTVTVQQGDTDVSPYGFGNFTSRSLNAGGGAAVRAARLIKAKLLTAAAAILDVDESNLESDRGVVRVAGRSGTELKFGDLCDIYYRTSFVNPAIIDPQLEATCTDWPDNFTHTPDAEGRTSSYPSFPFAAHVAVIEIDRETGCPTVVDYSCVHDCGVVINHKFVNGQLNGAIAMGIGAALFESSGYDESGQPLAATLKDYIVPRSTDLPTFRLASQETPTPYTLFGSKGAGESGLGGAMAAIHNAANDALTCLGASVDTLPLTPSRILDAIDVAEANRDS